MYKSNLHCDYHDVACLCKLHIAVFQNCIKLILSLDFVIL